MRTFNVDMIPGGSQTAVACNQYERGDIWVFALYYDGGRFDIPAGATVSITGQKSDGTAFNVPASVSDNTVLVTVTEQMTAAYGKCIAEVLVQSGNTTLYTANFYILVEPAAVQVPLADTTLPLSITAQDGTVYVQSDLEEATEQMITLAAQQQYQQDLASGVAQRVVEQYAGSTLAGRRQTVKSAIDELNSTSKRLLGSTEITAATDYNTLTTVGEYHVINANMSLITNAPVTSGHRITVEDTLGAGRTYIRQTVRAYNSEDVYTRRTQNGGTSWTAWENSNGEVVTITAGSGVSVASNNSVRIGKLVAINAYFQCDSVTAGSALMVGTVDANSRPASETMVIGYDNFSRAVCTGWLSTGGVIKLVPPATATSRSLRVSFCYKAK